MQQQALSRIPKESNSNGKVDILQTIFPYFRAVQYVDLLHIKSILKKNRIKYRVNYFDDDVYILGDYDKLKQVIINVLKNSVEAKDKNLKIDISTYLSKNNICISVKDNGVGIEDINKISKNYSSKLNGIGIGTLLSKNIILK